MFTKLTKDQLESKINFLKNYVSADNAATGSLVDPNANVSSHNIATLNGELMKDIFIQVNRSLLKDQITFNYGEDLAKQFDADIKDHIIYVNDETSNNPYCVSVSLYPFLTDGLTTLGGESKAPKHIDSFCGSFVNLIFAISSQFAGAVAAVEFLCYFDYFCRKDYGEDYHKELCKEDSEVCSKVKNHLQHIVYALNQPAAARNYQSVFFNISVYDENYFNSLFEDFVFPDFTKPNWKSIEVLQEFFLSWFNKERETALLTFPVVTAAMLTEGNKPKDEKFARMLSKQLAEGNSFFMYMSDSADSLSACCRLKSGITDNTFSFTLGAGGVATGSTKVITINVNRLVQKGYDIEEVADRVRKYLVSHRKLLEWYESQGMLPVYDAGYISLKKQYLTLGINGLVEAAEFKGIQPKPTQEYKEFVDIILKPLYYGNKEAAEQTGYMFNTEFVPAENLGVKNAKWDRDDNLVVPRDCYNSYFYAVEDEESHVFEKMMLHGADYVQYLDGGSALHLNLAEFMDEDKFYGLLCVAATAGVNYWCTNIVSTVCEDCGYINKNTLRYCSECGSSNVSGASRVIGYLKKFTDYSKDRKLEASKRHYHTGD